MPISGWSPWRTPPMGGWPTPWRCSCACRTWSCPPRCAWPSITTCSSPPTQTIKTGGDKTALMFRLAHQPGSLHDALDVFKQNKINLTWIESFPARTPKPEYIFFVDFEGHREDPKVTRALKALEAHCQELTVL